MLRLHCRCRRQVFGLCFCLFFYNHYLARLISRHEKSSGLVTLSLEPTPDAKPSVWRAEGRGREGWLVWRRVFPAGQCNYFSSIGQECQISQAAALLQASTAAPPVCPVAFNLFPPWPSSAPSAPPQHRHRDAWTTALPEPNFLRCCSGIHLHQHSSILRVRTA